MRSINSIIEEVEAEGYVYAQDAIREALDLYIEESNSEVDYNRIIKLIQNAPVTWLAGLLKCAVDTVNKKEVYTEQVVVVGKSKLKNANTSK